MADNENNEATANGAAATDAANHKHEHGHGHAHGHEHEEEKEVFVEAPVFNIEYKGECAYEVGVTIAATNKQKQSDELINELKDEAEVPGFRRGRAPRKLIERKFAHAVRSEVENKLVSAAFRKLVKDEKLHPIAMPDIDGLEADKERKQEDPLVFTFKFEVSPRVELGKYRGIEVERPVLEVDESEIDARIEELRARHAVFDTLEGGIAADGDQVVIDFTGKINGEEFQGGSAKSYPYILGTGRLMPEFEKVLLGSSPGDELSCEVTFPGDYFAEQLRGKQAAFSISVKEVKRRTLPELDDKFAKEAGYEDAADMRVKIAEAMRKSADDFGKQIAEERAMNAIIEDSTFEIPKSLIKSSTDEYYRNAIRRMLHARVPMEQIRAQEAELLKESEADAIRDIKRVVALSEISEAEGIEVTDEDFEQEMLSSAQRMGVDMNVLGNYINEDEERRNTYEDRIHRAKAMKLILDNAVITEKKVSREELEKDAEAESKD